MVITFSRPAARGLAGRFRLRDRRPGAPLSSPGPCALRHRRQPRGKARAAGIRVERITWGVYVLAGMLAALGGLAITGYVGAISANQGNGLIFTVFAASVIGGISLDGGKGTMFGALTPASCCSTWRGGQSADSRPGAVVLD